jgi:hypothetical protein
MVDGRIELIGMDASHRRCRWRTGIYQTPLEPAKIGGGIEFLTGSIWADTIPVEAGTDGEAGAVEFAEGRYRWLTAPTSVTEDMHPAGTVAVTPTGRYLKIIIETEAPTEQGAAGTIALDAGLYRLIAKNTPADDEAKGTVQFTTGTYQTP